MVNIASDTLVKTAEQCFSVVCGVIMQSSVCDRLARSRTFDGQTFDNVCVRVCFKSWYVLNSVRVSSQSVYL